MTANAMRGDRDRCLEAGMDGYVSKPVDRQELVAEIERVLGSALPVMVTALMHRQWRTRVCRIST
jgi:CheY-like chemotaxis protein